MNQITVAGHLGADPEVRFTSSGQKVTTLRVAARVRRGSKGDDTIWWRITIWGEQFDKMIPYFKKGSPIIVFGELNKPEIFTNRDGQPQVSMNITAQNLLFSPFGRPDGQNAPSGQDESSSFSGGQDQQQQQQDQQKQQQAPQKQFGQAQEEPAEALADEEIPF
ncbi:MAG: Single-stranded DNA-binding protein [Chlamydiae bacterium]|nr:Single-stranded DNA-binding protein [Chlamydiota bacterium]